MEDSILKTTKRLLGGNIEGDEFDVEIINSINAVFSVLTQLGVGPAEGFVVTGEDETWTDFIGGRADIEMIKMYVYSKVRLLFDPPSNSVLTESMKKICDEFEWRLNVAIETPSSE